MQRPNKYATRPFFASSAVAAAVIAGWVAGSAAFLGDDHRLLSIASPVLAGLAIVIAVIPALRSPQPRAFGVGGARPRLPSARPASAKIRIPSHFHIQRPARDYFSPYPDCGRVTDARTENGWNTDA